MPQNIYIINVRTKGGNCIRTAVLSYQVVQHADGSKIASFEHRPVPQLLFKHLQTTRPTLESIAHLDKNSIEAITEIETLNADQESSRAGL